MKDRIDKIVDIIYKNPGCWINYYDNGCWGIYSKNITKQMLMKDWDEEIEALLEGDDFSCSNGHIPVLVEVLARMLIIKVETE